MNTSKTRNFHSTICLLTVCFNDIYNHELWSFQPNSDINKSNNLHKYDLHRPTANLIVYPKGKFYAGIKLYSKFPIGLKSELQLALKRYFLTHIYSEDEFIKITLTADCSLCTELQTYWSMTMSILTTEQLTIQFLFVVKWSVTSVQM
jgi:hypothetical protein